jgi:tetratricopeptide (TPR) repeat protein
LDIPALVASHTTPALKNADSSQTTSLAALKSYLTYAQEQFALAAGREIAGSMALRGLGKLHDGLAKNQNTEFQAAGPKAILFYQASLLVAPQNYLAANDLGVLLARSGNLKDARAILEHTAVTGSHSIVLKNLARVYQKQGCPDLAAQANQRAMLAEQTEQTQRKTAEALAANGSVQWVNPDAFSQTSPNLTASPTMAKNSPSRPQPNVAVQQTAPPRPTTNTFGSNNPHWAPNYQQPPTNTNNLAFPTPSPVLGQLPSNGYQR